MAAEYIHNNKLFSDYYLDKLLPERDEWDRDCSHVRDELSRLLDDRRRALPTLNEAQTEEDFIRPVLRALGWEFQPQVRFRRRERIEIPDYALFASADDKTVAQSTREDRADVCGAEYLEKTAALGEAKYWQRPLEEREAENDRERRRDQRRSPHFQIIDYIDDADVRWGILTNGRRWRLYFGGGDTAQILYYEADLKAILESGDADDFRRFYLFFSADAFRPDEDELCLLDHVREESQQYAEAVEERLKERVFDSVVPALAGGFLRHIRREKGIEVGTGDREQLDDIYNGTLLLLYRLFFLLFAESRELIAVGESSGYDGKSLEHLKREIFEARNSGISLGARSTDWWDDLTNLFDVINGGDPGLNVPCYNGGLFHPEGLGDPDIAPAARFLEEHTIADRELAEAIMLLTRDVATEDACDDPRFIDFRDLGVRHLGSVYEGLLEFKLRVADEHLTRATEDGKPVWQPTDDPAEADREPGDLYLTNDKSERKATGSYYTPDYIVRYIVENTIGPQIDRIEREHALAGEIQSDEGDRRGWDELLDEVLADKGEDETHNVRELFEKVQSDADRRRILLNQLDGPQPDHDYDPPTRLLELNVLDPALGSGHFLVGALDYITTRLAGMLSEYADSPVFERIREDRARIVESLAGQDIQADEDKLTDENLLRRMVMKRCLYGVDLNPLAVELSKLSLWLHAFTAGAPLSFLDHHVKCGNSLIGTTLDELERRVEQAPGLFRLRMEPLERAVDHMLTVAELSDASFEDVQRSREEYWKADARVEAYRALLDSLTAEHFGVDDASHFIDYGMDIDLENFEESVAEFPEEDQERLDEARRVAHERRFFHWNVEFPEVFFERRNGGVRGKDDAGFDAVVGNPPYVRQEQLGSDKEYYELAYEVYHGVADIYVYFYELGHEMLQPAGLFGMITSNKFMRANYGDPLREFLGEKCRMQQLIDFGDLPVFGEVTAYPVICISAHRDVGDGVRYLEISDLDFRELQEKVGKEGDVLPASAFEGYNWSLTDAETCAVLQKMERYGVELGKLVDGEIYRGVLTGFNEAFIIDDEKRRELIEEDPRSEELIKPLVVGQDVKRYHVNREDRWLIFTRRGIDIDAYPAIKKHLGQWREDLEPKKTSSQSGPGRKPGDYEWYEIQDTVDYFTEFEKPKLMLPDIAARATVYWDDEGLYGTNTCYFTPMPSRTTCALVNSRLITAWYAQTAATYRGGYLRFFTQDVERIPIRRTFHTTPEKEREEQVEELKTLYAEAVEE
ncbi:MAG: Eco57I restriction-modification methylase domain-containing protein [Candidatus Brocadiia bacterium]